MFYKDSSKENEFKYEECISKDEEYGKQNVCKW